MSHKRQLIRDRVAVLLSGSPAGFAKITKSRVHSFQTEQLPGVAIHTLEESTVLDDHSRDLERTLRLVIDVHAAETDGIDDALDDLCVEVETMMESDHLFSGLALNSSLSQTTVGLSGEGDSRHGLARLEYTVVYHTPAGDPS